MRSRPAVCLTVRAPSGKKGMGRVSLPTAELSPSTPPRSLPSAPSPNGESKYETTPVGTRRLYGLIEASESGLHRGGRDDLARAAGGSTSVPVRLWSATNSVQIRVVLLCVMLYCCALRRARGMRGVYVRVRT